MSDKRRQEELLERFLSELARDPNAPVPPGLDSETAAFARVLAAAERTDRPGIDAGARVWARVLAEVRNTSEVAPGSPSPNGRYPQSLIGAEKMTILTTTPLPQQKRIRGLSITTLAAALAVILFGALLLYAAKGAPPGQINGAAGLPQSASATPTASPTATATPTASLTITPTPVPTESTATSTAVFGYVVAPGDTIIDIAARYSVPIIALQVLNPQLDWLGCDSRQPNGGPNCNPVLMVGQEIIVPFMSDPNAAPMPAIVTATAIPFNLEMEASTDAAPTPVPGGPVPVLSTMFPPTAVPFLGESIQIGLGQEVTGTLDEESPSLTYALNAQGGTMLSVNVEADGPVLLSSSSLSLPQPGGTNGSGGGGGGGPAQESVTATITVQADSVVWLTVSKDPEAGRVRFTLTTALVEVPAIAYGETAEVETTLEEINGQSGVTFGLWEFSGTRGDIVTVRADSGNDDLVLQLEGAGGEILSSDDDSGPGLNPEIYRYQLPQDGNYRIRVMPRTGWMATVRFSATLERAESLSLDDGPRTMTLSEKLNAWTLTFDGTEGETIQLLVDPVSMVGYQPNALFNILLFQNGQFFGEMSGQVSLGQAGEFTVPSDGPVTVFVNGNLHNDPEYGTVVAATLRLTLEH